MLLRRIHYTISIIGSNFLLLLIKAAFCKNLQLLMEKVMVIKSEKNICDKLVSVIIPIYNVEKYLPECLDSLLAQTYPHWQAICVNDGSKDNSLQILQQYAAKDKRFSIINQENQGLSMARNNGLKQAKGEYVYFLDSDDCLHPQCLEAAYSCAEKYQAEMVCFGLLKNKTGNIIPQKYNLSKIKIKVTDTPLFFQSRHGKYRISFNVWTKLYKRELLNGLEFIPKIHFEDYPHTYAVLARKPRTAILDAKLYFYTINPQSISKQKSTPQTISDYTVGTFFVCNLYQKCTNAKELQFIKNKFIPVILAEQLKRCSETTQNTKETIWKLFAEELTELNHKGFLVWRGHKLKNYFTYKKLIKEYGK